MSARRSRGNIRLLPLKSTSSSLPAASMRWVERECAVMGVSGKSSYRRLPLYVSVLVILVTFGDAIFRFSIAIVFNKWYSHKEACFGARCVSVVYEAHASFNSDIKRYVYLGRHFHLPIIDRNYVSFEDGAELCIELSGSDGFMIISNLRPIENNVQDQIQVSDRDSSGTSCGEAVF
jgi:hypothetical protein